MEIRAGKWRFFVSSLENFVKVELHSPVRISNKNVLEEDDKLLLLVIVAHNCYVNKLMYIASFRE